MNFQLDQTKHLSTKNPDDISQFEFVLLDCICKGMSCKEIASIISRSQRTVEKYRSRLYQKFHVRNRKELVVVAHTLLHFEIG